MQQRLLVAAALVLLASNRCDADTSPLPPSVLAAAAVRPPFNEARAIKELSFEEANRHFPADLTAVITYFDPDWNLVMVQDGTTGIFVNSKQKNGDLHPGQLVRVQGTTGPGTFAPVIDDARLTVQGTSDLPPTKPLSEIATVTGRLDNEWVEVTGIIRSVRHQDSHTIFVVATPFGSLNAVAPEIWSADSIKRLLDSFVRIQAVCGSDSNDKRQFVGVRLWVPTLGCVQVVQAATIDPFSLPQQTIASVLQYHSRQNPASRVHVKGFVTFQSGHNAAFVQDASDGARIYTREAVRLTCGELVEVVGYLTAGGTSPVIGDAVLRHIASGSGPAPIHATKAKLLGGSFEGQLIQLQARLIDRAIIKDEAVLSLESDNFFFEARLGRDGPKLSSLRIGSDLEVNGVWQVIYNEGREPTTFALLLRTPGDVTLLTAPSWWTPERASVTFGIGTALILVAIIWVSMLRRRVARQTKQIRQTLEQEAALERRYRNLFETAQDFIFTCNEQGQFSAFNQAGTRLTEFTEEEALGKSIFDLTASGAHDLLRRLLARNPSPGHPPCAEIEFITKSGQVHVMELTLSFLSQDGAGTEAQGIARDVTDRNKFASELKKARDSALEAARQKAEFLANMSHEIRTPMNGVIGMTNLLLDTALDRQQRDFAHTIHQSAEALLTVVNDILDFSKIEAGKLTFEHREFSLQETVEDALEVLSSKAEAKGIELGCALANHTPTQLRGDAMRIRQVLVNLVGNAVKFTERGEVIVSVSVERSTATHATLRFEVKDTGIGIGPETQARLFQPFTQAEGSNIRQSGGTGLGLAISKRLVALMGGEIGVVSEVGHGAVFWFTLESEVCPRSEPSAGHTLDQLAAVRVLIVDDNESNRRILEHQLGAWRMVSNTAENGSEALEQLRQAAGAGHPFDIALLDMQMPVMDGVTLAQAIKAESAIAGTRLVLLTSMGNQLSASELRQAGAAASLIKPVKQSRLFDCVATVMDSKSGPVPGTTRSLLDSTAPKKRGLRILLAEDNSINQKVALGQLQRLGFRAEVAPHGLAVLAALQDKEFDVILMDCQMPELDGYETTKRIRQAEQGRVGGRPRMHIIAMTAHAMKGDREKCLSVGMDDYVSKPIRTEELEQALERCLSIVRQNPEAGPSEPAQIDAPVARSQPIIDKERLLDAVGGDEQEARGLAHFYLEQAQEMMGGLEVAVETIALAEIERLAHKLAGASASCGIMGIVPLLRELEQCARAGDAPRVQALYDSIQQEHRVVREQLPTCFSELQNI